MCPAVAGYCGRMVCLMWWLVRCCCAVSVVTTRMLHVDARWNDHRNTRYCNIFVSHYPSCLLDRGWVLRCQSLRDTICNSVLSIYGYCKVHQSANNRNIAVTEVFSRRRNELTDDAGTIVSGGAFQILAAAIRKPSLRSLIGRSIFVVGDPRPRLYNCAFLLLTFSFKCSPNECVIRCYICLNLRLCEFKVVLHRVYIEWTAAQKTAISCSEQHQTGLPGCCSHHRDVSVSSVQGQTLLQSLSCSTEYRWQA